MRILIWGTGRLTVRYMKFEYFANYEIIGFIDSYKTNREFMGYRVYRPEEIKLLNYDCLLICVVHKGLEILQKCIAENIDPRKVLFVHGTSGFVNADNQYIQKLLCKEDLLRLFPIIYKDIEEKKTKSNYYSNNLDAKYGDGSLIHSLDENHIVVWIPIELLFSEARENIHLDSYSEEWIAQNKRWEDIPIISFEPLRGLFMFFMHGKNYPTTYCERYRKLLVSLGEDDEYTDEQLVEQRFREFMQMQHQLSKGMEFFIEHPVVAKWNDRGYFNILDGHHRTCFLYCSGFTRIPVQITKRDYDIWCNMEIVKAVRDIVLEQKREYFYQPILNPYFVEMIFIRDNYMKSRLHHILEYFPPKCFEDRKVIDIGANMGYMGQAFYRMGAEVTMLEPDIAHYKLMKKVNELMYTKCVPVFQKFEEYETVEEYDVAILLTVFCHYIDVEPLREQFIERLNKNVRQMIIWESGSCVEEEKEYIMQHTKFRNYQHLCYTYATGKYRELGIFMTDDSEYFYERMTGIM